jgi:hypothetical protein
MNDRRYAIGVLLVVMLALAPHTASSQEPRLAVLLEPHRAQVEAILDAARAARLPTEPLVDRALEGASKGADGERIVAAVGRLHADLGLARDAMGELSSAAEIVAGASALRAGASPGDLTRLRELRGDQSLTVVAAVLADLVAVGVPADTAVVAVLALAPVVDDAQYIAFRQSVARDIALGASPVAALGVRLESSGAADALGISGTGQLDFTVDRPPRPRERKP